MHRGLGTFPLKDAHGEIRDESCHETTLGRHKVHRATGQRAQKQQCRKSSITAATLCTGKESRGEVRKGEII